MINIQNKRGIYLIVRVNESDNSRGKEEIFDMIKTTVKIEFITIHSDKGLEISNDIEMFLMDFSNVFKIGIEQENIKPSDMELVESL